MRTLFLDRDGVINERIVGSYVMRPDQFVFLPGVLEAIVLFRQYFDCIVVVTNQQGVGRQLFTINELENVHKAMIEKIETAGGKIDKVYYCTELAEANSACRKPNTGMGLQAKKDFPAINFAESIMVGDSISDMTFGQRLGMKTVFITTKTEEQEAAQSIVVDWRYDSLAEFAHSFINKSMKSR